MRNFHNQHLLFVVGLPEQLDESDPHVPPHVAQSADVVGDAQSVAFCPTHVGVLASEPPVGATYSHVHIPA